MAVNKNFVVKNGLEVNPNLIVADTDAQKVGIGTTISRYLLHVNGGTGIGASSVYVTGISTVAQEFNVGLGGSIFTVLGNAEGTAGIGQSVGVGTGEPAYLLDVRSPVSTGQTALYVQGDMRITGDINLDDLRLDQLQVSGISSFIGLSTFASGITVLGLGATTTTLEVSGFSTFSDTVKVDTLTENRVVIVGSGKTLEDDANFTYDGTRLNVGTNLGVTGVSTFTGIGTFISDLYVGGDLYIRDDISLDSNLNILGIATIGTLNISSASGINTIDSTVQSSSKDTGALVIEGGVGIEKNLFVGGGAEVTGLTTITGALDANGDLDVDGHTELDDVNVSGASTFVGVGTFQSDLYVGGDLYISEDITLDTNLSILGIATIGTLAVTGVATAALFGGYAALSAPASAETKNFAVTVAAKTSNNRYSGGSGNAYYIDGIEAPFLTLTPGRTYRFTLSSSDMTNHPFRFYLEADRSTAYTTDVTSTSTYTEIIVTDTTPTVLHYQCSAHGLMGNSVQTNSNTIVVSGISTFTGNINASANLDVDGTTDLDVLNVAQTATFSAAIDANGDLDVDGHTELDNVNVAGFSTFASDITIGTGATVGFGSTAYFRDNAKAIFGDDEDLVIHHNGSNSIIAHNGTGDLLINTADGEKIYIDSSEIILRNAGSSETLAKFTQNGSVELYHDNDKKFETTGAGVTVAGGIRVSGVSTFVGFATFSDYVFVQDGLNVAGVITATSFDGLGQIGVGSEGTFIGVGITMVDFKSSNASNTVEVNGTSGIATVTVTTGVSLGLAIALGG